LSTPIGIELSHSFFELASTYAPPLKRSSFFLCGGHRNACRRPMQHHYSFPPWKANSCKFSFPRMKSRKAFFRIQHFSPTFFPGWKRAATQLCSPSGDRFVYLFFSSQRILGRFPPPPLPDHFVFSTARFDEMDPRFTFLVTLITAPLGLLALKAQYVFIEVPEKALFLACDGAFLSIFDVGSFPDFYAEVELVPQLLLFSAKI